MSYDIKSEIPTGVNDFIVLSNSQEVAIANAAQMAERKRCCRIVTGLCFSDNDSTKIIKKIVMGDDETPRF